MIEKSGSPYEGCRILFVKAVVYAGGPEVV